MNSKDKILPYLRKLDLGEDVAEYEQGLTSYFVPTGVFFSLAQDEADIILGPKGSGKSAMSRYLANGEPKADGDLAHTDIIPAFNAQGSVIFQRFEYLADLGEAGMRTLWMTYLTSLVANHLVDKYEVKPETRSLDRLLEETGLRLQSPEPKSVWASITDRLRSMLQLGAAEGALTFSPDGIPVITGKVSLAPKQVDAWPSASHLDRMIQVSLSILIKLNRRCWVILDRLDEAFQHDANLERLALKSLLRAHLDLVSYGKEIKSKLFLRTELLDRITKASGFVNATHLRIERIYWSADDIVHMITLRILNNPEICAAFGLLGLDPSLPGSRVKACSVVLPSKIDGARVIGWIIKHTTDGSTAINPRNVITLLRTARSQQLRLCERDNIPLSRYAALIGPDAIKFAYTEVSKLRLSDTLLAEFPNIQPYVEKLRGTTNTWNTADILCRHLGLEREDRAVIDELIYSGLIMYVEGRHFSLPLLYKPALRLPQVHQVRSVEPESIPSIVLDHSKRTQQIVSPADAIEPISIEAKRRRRRRSSRTPDEE